MKADAVVDRPQPAVVALEAMAALAVGVVGEHVEDRQALDRLVVAALLLHREEMRLVVGVDEQLHRSNAMRPVAQDGGRHKLPAKRFAQQIGRNLALAEGATREIPERALAAARLIDRQALRAIIANGRQQCVVAAPWQHPLDLKLALHQKREHIGDAKFGWLSVVHTGRKSQAAGRRSHWYSL